MISASFSGGTDRVAFFVSTMTPRQLQVLLGVASFDLLMGKPNLMIMIHLLSLSIFFTRHMGVLAIRRVFVWTFDDIMFHFCVKIIPS